MFKKIFPLILFICYSFLLIGQDFEEGYYFLKDSTKIEGFLSFDRKEENVFKFKKVGSKRTKRISTDKAIGFTIGDRKFEKITLFSTNDFEIQFAELLVEGPLKVYRDYKIITKYKKKVKGTYLKNLELLIF